MSPNLAVELVETTLVCVHNEKAPSDADWELFLAAWRQHRATITAQLVVTAGGGPSLGQRRTSLEIIAGRPGGAPPTAVVTDAVVVRGIVTALSWFVRDRIKAFSPNAMEGALAFLGVVHQREALLATVRRLQISVATTKAASA